MPPLLEVAGLRKFYPVSGAKRWRRTQASWLHAVDGVGLTIGQGECVGLVGESGCGKSTLVRLLARLIDPTSGDILLEGRKTTAVSQARFTATADRARIQVVFQDPTESLNPSFRVFRSIADPIRRLLGIRDRTELTKRV